MLSVNDHFQACSCAALNGVSSLSPKDCLLKYIQTLATTSYSSADKKYVSGFLFGYYVHVFFVGPNHNGWTVNRDHHYSAVGSCDQLAAYIRLHNLGPVVESEPRWNHRHATRPKGQGDLIAYIWSPDPDALERWHAANHPTETGTLLGTTPTKVEPLVGPKVAERVK